MSVGKFFFIRSQLNELVLEVADGVAAPGQKVTPHDSHGGDNQLWWEDRITETIRTKLDDDYVLDIQGNELVINEYSPDEPMQKWRLAGDKVQHTEEEKVLDIAGHNAEEGARVCCWDDHGGSNQKWSFEHVPPKYMYIKSKMHGRVMDVREADPSAGNKAIMWKKQDNEPDNQLWYEDKYGYIHAKLNDFVFDSSGNSIELHPYDPDMPTRQWVKSGSRIVNKNDPSMCIDIKGAETKKGAKLCAYEYQGAENQLWKFEYL